MFSKLFRKSSNQKPVLPAVSKEAEARLLILALKNGQPIRKIR